MKRDVLAQFVLDQAQSIVSPNGRLALQKVENGTAYVRYEVLPNERCSACTVTVDDLKSFLMDLSSSRAPHIASFDIDMVEQGAS